MSSNWAWGIGLVVSLLIVLIILLGQVTRVEVPDKIPGALIDHVQTVTVLDDELEVPVKAAIFWAAQHGCEFEYTDDLQAEITVSIEENLMCGSINAVGCASSHDGIKEIRVEIPAELVLKHELLHHHNLEHPVNAPSGHVLHPHVSDMGDNDRGVAAACARTRAY